MLYALKIGEKAVRTDQTLKRLQGAVVLVESQECARKLHVTLGLEAVDAPDGINWGLPVIQDASGGEPHIGPGGLKTE